MIDMNKIYNQITALLYPNRNNKLKYILMTANLSLKTSLCKYVNIYEDTEIDSTNTKIFISKISNTKEIYNAYIINNEMSGKNNHFIINSNLPIEIYYHFISENFDDFKLCNSIENNDIKILRDSIKFIIHENFNITKTAAYNNIKNISIISQYLYVLPDVIIIRVLNEISNDNLTYENYCDIMDINTNKTIITEKLFDGYKSLYNNLFNEYNDIINDFCDMNNMVIISKVLKESVK